MVLMNHEIVIAQGLNDGLQRSHGVSQDKHLMIYLNLQKQAQSIVWIRVPCLVRGPLIQLK